MNEKELLEKVKKNPWYLEQIPEELQTEEICLTSVKQYGLALQFVKNQTEEMCLEAVKQYGWILQFVKNQTEEICLAAVRQNGRALQYVEKQTKEICLEAVMQHPDALHFVKEKYLTKEILLIVIKNFKECIYKKDIKNYFNKIQKQFPNEYNLFVLRWCL